MANDSTQIFLEDGTVVDEATGEIIELAADADPITQFTRLALDAEQQRRRWEADEKLYKLVLNKLGVQDATTSAGRAVRRGGYFRASAPRALFDGSLVVQDLPWEQRADIALECFGTLDPKRVDEMFEAGRLDAGIADAIVQQKRIAEWVEVKVLKKQAPERKAVGA